ncbi:ATP-binding cassette domain-containing protein [Nonomuraea sp. NPDC050556]|uniref:ATP-binding cassette domain-containing protein n=1 Tax=Nonomuraea sp. NPDC050556 TaxID=3364369 RepID=UPI0037A3CF7A
MIQTEGLTKHYGTTRALDGLDLTVAEGAVCGLLGPNGAGKTTAVRILATLLLPSSGRATVAGLDVVRQAAQVRRRIGLAGQEPTVDEILTGRENLEMWARLYSLPAPRARARAGELLDRFGLGEAADRRVKHYSGGMRRRLDVAIGLILAPGVLFLDEPTTGLDPRNRAEVWRSIRELARGGTTVLLTTQYLEEADQLAHQIVVLDRGRAIADGPPDELKAMIGGDQIDLVVHDRVAEAAAIVGRVTGSSPEVDADLRRIVAPVRDRVVALVEVMRAVQDAGVTVEDVSLRRPTLDEVFLRLTEREVAA